MTPSKLDDALDADLNVSLDATFEMGGEVERSRAF